MGYREWQSLDRSSCYPLVNIVDRDMKLEWNRSMSLSGLQSHLISCDPSAAHNSLMKLAYVGGRGRPPPPPPPPRVQALAVDGVATAEVVKVCLSVVRMAGSLVLLVAMCFN